MTIKTEQRILIALDAHETTEESLNILAIMASQLHAPLAGLFVEDSRLLNIAELPFTTEIKRITAQEQNFHSGTLSELNKSVSAKIQRLLEELSARHKIAYSFRTEPGELISKALTQEGVDVFFPARKRDIPQPKVFYQKKTDLLKLTLIYDASPQFERALEIVRTLAKAGLLTEITLLCDTDIPESLAQKLAGTDIKIKILSVSSITGALRDTLHMPASTLLLMPKQRITYDELTRLFTELTTPLLLLN